MEQETLFTAVKWDILKAIAEKKKSPLELAEQYKTSVSNVSQSLRFLELAGLVKSERISNRDKGLPRVIYSLTSEKAYIVILSQGFAEKNFIEIDAHRKSLLRIWFYEDKYMQPLLEGAMNELSDILPKSKGIFFDKTSGTEGRIAVLLDDKTKPEGKDLTIKHNGISKKFKIIYLSQDQLMKSKENYYPLHDPLNIFGGANKQ